MELEDVYMAIALLASAMSKDFRKQVGACIVAPDGEVISVGFNGLPDGSSYDDFPRKKTCSTEYSPEEQRRMYVCHSEMSALLMRSRDVRHATVYCTLGPCWHCARSMLKAGISTVKYGEFYHKGPCEEKGRIEQYKPSVNSVICIDLYKKEITIEKDDGKPCDDPEVYPNPLIGEVHLKWDDFFIGMAFLASRMVLKGHRNGVYIVNEHKRFVAVGCDTPSPLASDPGVCHAICNAILASPSPDLRHCILYSLYFPCNKCAQVIVQSGIRQVLYTEDKSCSECDDSSVVKASKRVLNNARVFYREYDCGVVEPSLQDLEWYSRDENRDRISRLKKTTIHIQLNGEMSKLTFKLAHMYASLVKTPVASQ